MPSGRRGGQFSRSAAKKGAGKTKRKNISDRKIVSDGSDGGKVRDPSGMSNPVRGSAYKRARVHPVVASESDNLMELELSQQEVQDESEGSLELEFTFGDSDGQVNNQEESDGKQVEVKQEEVQEQRDEAVS